MKADYFYVSLYALKHKETNIISHLVLANSFNDAKNQYQEDYNYFIENNPLDPNIHVVKEYYSNCDVVLLCNIELTGGNVIPVGEVMPDDAASICEVNTDEI